jgi:general secretion pathway protein E
MSFLESVLSRDFNVSTADLDKARSFQAKYHGTLEGILVSMGSLSSEMLPAVYSRVLGLPVLQEQDVSDWLPSPEWERQFQLNALLVCGWVPFNVSDEHVVFATTNPLAKDALEILSDLKNDFTVVVCSTEHFNQLKLKVEQLSVPEGVSGLTSVEEARLRELASEAPTVNLLNALVNRAIRMRASDMHVEPSVLGARIRFRIDGVLQEVESIPQRLVLPLVTRLKILSEMDIAERRRPQDGKIEMRVAGSDLDIRVSALPLNDGESVVMRFLRKDAIQYDMAALGISEDVQQQILQDIQTTSGVILLTGPTGSGKTTSLYTFLHRLNQPGVKIITLEDPVEYQLPGINQVQVQSDIGFDFAAGLRSIVRQDPDIIMLGEIRDKETARIAMQSALTGHLVFSTVHTNDAASAYTRLLDLGVEEFLLNAALVSIVAQRLVRHLCLHCAEPMAEGMQNEIQQRYELQGIADRFNGSRLQLKNAKGCEHCNGTGYRGRIAIIEYLRCDEAIRQLPKNENFLSEAKQLNQARGGRDLLQDGLLKVILGQTTIEEVLRVAG